MVLANNVSHKYQYVEFENQCVMVLEDGALRKELYYGMGTS